MTEHTQTGTGTAQETGHRGRFGVEFSRSVADGVTAYYDTEVTAPIDASEADLRQQAAEAVTDAVEGVTPADLTEAHQWLEASLFGAGTEIRLCFNSLCHCECPCPRSCSCCDRLQKPPSPHFLRLYVMNSHKHLSYPVGLLRLCGVTHPAQLDSIDRASLGQCCV